MALTEFENFNPELIRDFKPNIKEGDEFIYDGVRYKITKAVWKNLDYKDDCPSCEMVCEKIKL